MQGTLHDEQLISLPERLQISRTHAEKFPSKHDNPYKLYKDYWNKPTNIEIKDLLNQKLNRYSVTLKLDGVRRFLMVSDTASAIYSLSPPDDSWKIGSKSDLKFTLIDAEYYDGDYYAFDILYYDGDNIGSQSFDERFLLMQRAVKAISGKLYDGAKLTVKDFYSPPAGFYENVRAAFDKMDATPLGERDKYDGLILQPPGPYKNNDTKKWKPEWQMTIDFSAILTRAKDDEYSLWVGHNKDLVRFEGTKRYPYNKTVIIPGGKFDGLNVEGMIIEFKWDQDTENFLPYRLREDRDRPNARTTAEDVWRDIMEPVSRATMEGDTLDVVRRYDNDTKRNMLDAEFTQGDTIIDFGSGKGGDLSKWRDKGLKKVYVVEPNGENLAELEKRAAELGLRDLYQIVRKEDGSLVGAQDSEDISIAVGDDQVAGIVAFFSLTFFGKDRETFKSLIESIDALLPTGGKLVGIVMDGQTVARELQSRQTEEGYAPSIHTPAYNITQVSKFSDRYEEKKNEIDIDIKGAATVHEQREWLFYYDLFKSALASKGIREVRSNFLNSGPIWDVLPKSSQLFSSLYRTFVFKRSDKVKRDRPSIEIDGMEPFANEYNEELYTINVEKDRSSFVRAVVRAFDSDYLSMNTKERDAYVAKIRGMLSRKASDIELYAGLNNGEIEKEYTAAELYDLGYSEPETKIPSSELIEAEETGQLVYRHAIADPNQHLSHKDVLDLMAKVLGINIMVLKANSIPVPINYGMPPEEYKQSLENKKTVIVVYDSIYYSLLAKRTDDDIYTMFDVNNTLVRKILE
jgi:hypothetical protein